MPLRPVAYAAEYEWPEENPVATRQRQITDSIHNQHMKSMQPPIAKELVHEFIKSKSPNKKRLVQEQERQQEISIENNILVEKMQKIHDRKEKYKVESYPKPSNGLLRERFQSKIKHENKVLKSHLNQVKGTYNVATWAKEAQETEKLLQQISKVPRRAKTKQNKRQTKKFEIVNELEFLVLDKNQIGMPTAKEIKAHVESKLPIIHQKAAMYKLDPFNLPRRPFEYSFRWFLFFIEQMSSTWTCLYQIKTFFWWNISFLYASTLSMCPYWNAKMVMELEELYERLQQDEFEIQEQNTMVLCLAQLPSMSFVLVHLHHLHPKHHLFLLQDFKEFFSFGIIQGWIKQTIHFFWLFGNKVILPNVILTNVPFPATLTTLPGKQVFKRKRLDTNGNIVEYAIVDENGVNMSSGHWNTTLPLTVSMSLSVSGTHQISCTIKNGNLTMNTMENVRSFPGILSLVPPFITLFCSLLMGQVMIALLVGIWTGATLVSGGNPWLGFIHTFDVFWVQALSDQSHAGVLLFTIILGGTIGVVQKGGGAHGLAHLAAHTMNTSFRMQLATWILCCSLFFDDYSMILILGSSLRQILPRTGVSKEKFASIIHTMAVCLPSMAPVSSWIGVEIGYVAAVLQTLDLDWDPFVTCLSSLQYRLFPILFIAFIFITIIFEKDFGPMLIFERAVAESDEILSPLSDDPVTEDENKELTPEEPKVLGPMEPDPSKPMRAVNAIIPFGIIVAATFCGMILDGFQSLARDFPGQSFGVLDALSHSDSVSALIRASALGWAIAVLLLVFQRIATIQVSMTAWIEGVKDVMEPTLILTLAWALGAVIGEAQTASYVIVYLPKLKVYIASTLHGQIAPGYLPAIASVLCCIVSFATGTSYGTMAIMLPIICPLSYKVSGKDANNLMQCIGAVLGASTFGNTCSPIADTSIITALSVNMSLQTHIETMLPYALVVATISCIGTFFLGVGVVSTFTGFAFCFLILLCIVHFCGTRIPSRFRSSSNEESALSGSPSHRYSMLPLSGLNLYRYSFLAFVSPPNSTTKNKSNEYDPLLTTPSEPSSFNCFTKLFSSKKNDQVD
ncbi:NhaC Na:H antiporter (NhaC) family protein [Thraustotheca clavata]|uniref:NhaC Na:H antiporter (NhaC) family protein n=1 Tax=Thraustotheca clavata TaxID=74557 RepID=A0A1V9YV72_9STRA|nr:NhaC Na:H antiporter (NhaC) family protein [Thraustotheca clavata]